MTNQSKTKLSACCGAKGKTCGAKKSYSYYHPQGDCSKCGKSFIPQSQESINSLHPLTPSCCGKCGKSESNGIEHECKENECSSKKDNYIESVLKELNNLGYSQLFKDEKIFICPVCKNTEFICKKCIESFLSTALAKQRAGFVEKIEKIFGRFNELEKMQIGLKQENKINTESILEVLKEEIISLLKE